MNTVDWKKKLSSRKFWALLAGLATSAMVLLNVSENTAAQVAAVIGAFGSVVVYILSEAYVDGRALGKGDEDIEED
ncbi:MAG: hypothetical protein ABRQ26_06005 [Syntrophomonadaceae bacterium]